VKRSSDFLPFGDLSPAEIFGFLFFGLGLLILVCQACGCGGSPFNVALDGPSLGDAGVTVDPTRPDALALFGKEDAGAPQEASSEGAPQGTEAATDAPRRDAGEEDGALTPDVEVAVADASDDRTVKSFSEPSPEAGPSPIDPACLACSITCSSSELVYQCTKVTSVSCGHSSFTAGDPACTTAGACTVGGPCGLPGNPACWGGTVIYVRGASCP
jgi:hypothetical protein